MSFADFVYFSVVVSQVRILLWIVFSPYFFT